MNLLHALGISPHANGQLPRLTRQVKLQLVASGLVSTNNTTNSGTNAAANGAVDELADAEGILQQYREQIRLLADHRCPADQRIEAFLANYFRDEKLQTPLRLPDQSLVLHRHGLAREMSLPETADEYASDLLTSFRTINGVLHNPRADRRTTEGTFHVAEGGLPVPQDKRAVPRHVFAKLFQHAVNPPLDVMMLPFTAKYPEPARTFVSLLLRPMVCPEVSGTTAHKSMEIRFFAPGSLVSNLDFVESIFGNAGDPFLPENDAALDVEHWTGHSGCVILAPHLTQLTKSELGLPKWDDATPRQQRDGMCWRDPAEKYNDGVAFKLTCRNAAGVIVTLIADNYFGYCKKEVKTQISFAANLYGNCEEEHAGGAVAFTSYNFGDEYSFDSRRVNNRTFADVTTDYGHLMNVLPEGYAIDKNYPNLLYIPENSRASVRRQEVFWPTADGGERAIPMMPGMVYMTPSGFKLKIEKHPGAPSWRIVGTRGEGTVCHKPCTVSGGGKSEISKSLSDYMLYGPIFVADIDQDMQLVEQILHKDYSSRWRSNAAAQPDYSKRNSRAILSPERSLGSLIKLLTPSADYSDEYNKWLADIPNYIYSIVFVVKRFYRPEWGEDWRSHFSVDTVNGFPGHELKYGDRKIVGTYLRVGLTPDNSWRTYKLRLDFVAAAKIQTEDDISASVTLPRRELPALRGRGTEAESYKFVANCEYRLFQRPDDAINRGLDKQTEADFARPDNFTSNFQPLSAEEARGMVARVADFDRFTAPMKQLLQQAAEKPGGYVVCSASPRLVDGKPSKNPRYLQVRPDLVNPMSKYVAEMGMRLFRAVPGDQPLLMPVDAVLVGRRNNPEDKAAGIPGLAVYNPIHYQELPELFMDFICSLTGRSPSTTGAGSEGALTKAPFNALRPTADLNAALLSYIFTGLSGFSTSAGYVGPDHRIDHDISLLVPEIWCRLDPKERDPKFLIENGHLEPLRDFSHDGKTVMASRLGYRITAKFVATYFGRVFDNPAKVFDEAILKPETQDTDAFATGVRSITDAHQRVAKQYFEDGSIEDACPPLRALLTIMATGSFENKDVHHPDIRAMFTREQVLGSDWYRQRLATKQRVDVALWQRHVRDLETFAARSTHRDEAERFQIPQRRELATAELARVSSPRYLESLVGTIGVDPTLT